MIRQLLQHPDHDRRFFDVHLVPLAAREVLRDIATLIAHSDDCAWQSGAKSIVGLAKLVASEGRAIGAEPEIADAIKALKRAGLIRVSPDFAVSLATVSTPEAVARA